MDELGLHVDSLERLKYADLQKLAKKFGIRANIKGDKIITSLRELADHPEIGNAAELSKGEESLKTQTQNKSATQDNDSEVNVNTRTRRKTKTATRGKKHHQSAKLDSDEDEIIFKVSATTKSTPNATVKFSSTKTPTAKRSIHVHTPTRKSLSTLTPKSIKTPVHTFKAQTTKSDSRNLDTSSLRKQGSSPKSITKPSKIPTPIAKTPIVKASGKRSRSLAPSSDKKTPLFVGKSDTPKTVGQPDSNQDGSGKRRRSRRDTYTTEEPSPGVKDLLLSMKDDMTEQEQKDMLLSKLEEKVQQKKDDLPSTGMSHIPRFTGFPKIEQSADGKRKTPSKDWSKIHKRQWDKMDSIDDYLAKKRKRTESVTQSVKKLKLMTEQMRANLKKPKSPLTQNKLSVKKKPVQPSTTLTKPVNKPKAALFQSPAPATFKPKVTSISKANFNFGSMYSKDKCIKSGRISPTKGLRKSPRANPAKTMPMSVTKPLFIIGKNGPPPRKSIPASASKENIANRTLSISVDKRKSVGTPFKQAANTSLSNTNKFDISASLARPITWQTHKGKLKPFAVDTKSIHRTDVKEVKIKSREERREDHNKLRKDKRKDNLARRRGINI